VGTGTSSSNTTLNVQVKISVNLRKGNKTLEEGGDLSLYCNAAGIPTPTVTWTKVGDNYPVKSSSWLNFTNVNKDKAGNYTCNGNNTCGKKSSSVKRIKQRTVLENSFFVLNMKSLYEHSLTSPVCQSLCPTITVVI